MYDEQHINRLRNIIESEEPGSMFECLRQVSVDVSNVCDQKCYFCPQSKGWTSKHGYFMDIRTSEKLQSRLKECGFKNRVMVCGKGEPMLNPDIERIIEILSNGNSVSMITNGMDKDKDRWRRICGMCSCVLVSCHKIDDMCEYNDRFLGMENVIIRNHDGKNPNMRITNRGGFFDFGKTETGICSYPFYHLDIEPDGTYRPCGQNWVSEYTTKPGFTPNLFNMSIQDYFLNEMEPIRKSLATNDRKQCEYCRNCDCEGMVIGQKFVDYWRKNNAR